MVWDGGIGWDGLDWAAGIDWHGLVAGRDANQTAIWSVKGDA